VSPHFEQITFNPGDNFFFFFFGDAEWEFGKMSFLFCSIQHLGHVLILGSLFSSSMGGGGYYAV
jgi:hypothetical protein